MAVSLAVYPEKFDSGDFPAWIRNFECCADANGWSLADRLRKLPAFLRGQASSYYHSLSADQKDSYENLTVALRQLFCPLVAREQHFSDFEKRTLRPNEDPSIFLWHLRQILDLADPNLSEDARTILLTRQFMKSLPADLRNRLLESDPTPSLEKMRDFVRRHRAIHSGYEEKTDFSASCLSGQMNGNNTAIQSSMLASIEKLTAAVSSLASKQEILQAAVEENNQPQQQLNRPKPRWRQQPISSGRQNQQARCFNCNQVGHVIRNCPWDTQCFLCHGWGHTSAQCANNFEASSVQAVPAAPEEQHQSAMRMGSQQRPPPQQGNFVNRSVRYSSTNNVVSPPSFSNSLNFKGVPQ